MQPEILSSVVDVGHRKQEIDNVTTPWQNVQKDF
jgi:hypothetical protein